MNITRFKDRNVDSARELVRQGAKEKPSEVVTCTTPYKQPMTSKNSTLGYICSSVDDHRSETVEQIMHTCIRYTPFKHALAHFPVKQALSPITLI